MADGRVIVNTKVDNSGLDEGISKAESKLSKLGQGAGKIAGSAAKGIATAVGVAGTAVTAFGVSSLKAGGQFDKSMSSVQAISGATGQELESMRDMAKDLGSTTVFSASEAADAMGELALMGFETNDILGATPGVLDLAAAAGMGLQESAGLVASTMNQFQMEAKDAGKAADIFAKAQASSGTTASEMGEAMKYAGGAAHAFNMDLTQTSAVLGIFADAGIVGGQAGTTFVAMLNDMKKNAKDGKIAIGDTSIALHDANGNFRDAGTIMADVEKATEGMTSAQKDAALMSIFGQQSMKGVNAMLSKGSDAYKELEDTIRHSTVQLGEHSIELNDAEGNWRSAEDVIKDVEAATKGMSKEQKEAAIETAFASKGIENMNGILAKGEAGYAELEEAIKNSKTAVEEMSDVMTDNLPGDIEGMKSALEGLQIAFHENLDTPAREVVQSVTGYFTQLKETMEQDASKVPQVIGEIMTDIIVKIAESLPSILEQGGRIIKSLIQGIMDNKEAIGGSIAKIMTSLITTIIEVLPSFLVMGASIILEIIKGLFGNEGQLLSSLSTIISSMLMQLKANLPNFIEKGFEFVGSMIQGILNNLPQIVTTIASLVLQLIWVLAENLPLFLTKGVEFVGKMVVGIVQSIPEMMAAGGKVIGGLITGIGAMIGAVGRATWEVGKTIINKMKGVSLKGIGRAMMQGLIGGVTAMASAVWDAVVGTVMKPINWVKKKLGIKSPSRYMRYEIGARVSEGAALGVKDNEDMVENATGDMTEAMIPDTSNVIPQMATVTAGRSMVTNNTDNSINVSTDTIEALLQVIAGNTEAFKNKRYIAKDLAPYMSQELAFQGRR